MTEQAWRPVSSGVPNAAYVDVKTFDGQVEENMYSGDVDWTTHSPPAPSDVARWRRARNPWRTARGHMPSGINNETLVSVMLRDGTVSLGLRAGAWNWNHRDEADDTMKWRYAEIPPPVKEVSDGSKADYYNLPEGAKTIEDLIAFRNMNHSMGEILCADWRYGLAGHSDPKRDLKKIIYYAQAELDRLEKYGE